MLFHDPFSALVACLSIHLEGGLVLLALRTGVLSFSEVFVMVQGSSNVEWEVPRLVGFVV